MTVSAFTPIALDLSWMTSHGASTSTTPTATQVAAKRYAPTPPWDASSAADKGDALVRSALSGKAFFNERSAQLDLPGASDDYRKLFALYQGLNGLLGLADAAKAKGVSSALLAQYSKAFARGMAEAQTYLQGLKLDQVRLTQGSVKTSVATAGMAQAVTHYVAKTFAASPNDAAAALQGPVKFDITVTRGHTDTAVAIDLDEMGDTPRTLGAVTAFINQRLAAAGVATRFATQRQPGETTTVAGKSVTGPDRWGLAVNTGRLEQVSFSAPQTAPAVYVTQVVGKAPSTTTTTGTTSTSTTAAAKTDPQTGQLLKLQADGVADDRLVGKTLEGGLVTTHATAAVPGGGLYVLGDATTAVDGQAIKGAVDAVLQKYDSAGKLVWSRTLGAAGSASGLALAVDDDGRIAIGGQVTGALQGDAGRKGEADSFVTLFDAGGREVWTQRRAAIGDDHVTGLAFADNGMVLVQGQSQPTGGAATTQAAWLEGIATAADGKPKVAFDQAYATGGGRNVPDGIAVSGSAVYVAGTEAGHAVVRCFSLDTTPPQQVATRDLGDLGGGSIAGIGLDDAGRLVVAGSSSRTDLNAGQAVTDTGGGGQDLFAAVLSPDLTPSDDDHVSWFGGTGNETIADMKVAGGQVWLLGATKGDLPGLPKMGDQDGFVVSFDTETGQLGYSRRFAGAAGMDQPASLTVVADGASVLDRLGLPTGGPGSGIGQAQSDRLVDNTSLRAGDSFQIRTPGGTARKIVLDAADTLDTLAAKIRRAAGFAVTVATAQVNGRRQLTIKPAGNRQTAELLPGPGGRDALGALGLPAGVLRATAEIKGKLAPADGKGEIYGLAFDPSLTLATPDAISHAVAQINGSLSTVIGAYRDLKAAASPAPAATTQAVTGTPPAYLKAQIANYTAALARLQGG